MPYDHDHVKVLTVPVQFKLQSSKDAVNEKRPSDGQGITRLQMEENASNSNKSNGKSNVGEGDTFTLYRHLQGEDISNHPNEPSRAVHANLSPSIGYTEKATNSARNEYGDPRRRNLNSFQALLGDESGSASPVEKTLYIDSVQKIKSPDSSSKSLDMKGISYSGDMIDDASIKSTETKELYTLDSAIQDVKKWNAVSEKDIPRPDSSKYLDSRSPTSSGRSLFAEKVDSNYSRLKPEHTQDAAKMTSSQFLNKKKFDLENQFPLKPSSRVNSNGLANDTTSLISSHKTHSDKINLDRKQPEKSSYESNNLNIPDYVKNYTLDGKELIESGIQEKLDGPVHDSPDLRTSEGTTNGKKDSRNQFLKRAGNEDGSHGGGCSHSRLRFAPPPPKSPSDSWLKRALPTSARNSLQSSLAMRLNTVSMASPNPKTDSIVKGTDINSLHLQFSKVME